MNRTSNDQLYVWGDNRFGAVGDPKAPASMPDPDAVLLPDGDSAIAIAAGAYHTVALGYPSGRVYAWGANESGQLGVGSTTPERVPTPVVLPSGTALTAIAIAAGAYHSLAIGTDGQLYAWGENQRGQVGNGKSGPAERQLTPVVVTAAGEPVRPVAVAAGGRHSLAITPDYRLWGWGDNRRGQLGDGSTTDRPYPVLAWHATGDYFPVTAVAGGGHHTLAIGTDGHVYAWGANDRGQLGDSGTADSPVPELITLPHDTTALAVAAGWYHSVVMGASSGRVYTWGANNLGQLGTGVTGPDVTTPTGFFLPADSHPAPGAWTIAAGAYHTLAVGASGQLYAWGSNLFGQLGLHGTGPAVAVPTAVPAPHRPVCVAAGGYHSLAIGTCPLGAWGMNIFGELGIGTEGWTGNPFNPVSPAAFARVRTAPVILPKSDTPAAIAAGEVHSLAIGSSGSLYAWGAGSLGAVGNGTTSDALWPVEIVLPDGDRAGAIAAGMFHSAAIGLPSQRVYVWGDNRYGQLADGPWGPARKLAPALVTKADGTALTATAIAAGWGHNLAIGTDGVIYAWGLSACGQLGEGRTTTGFTPAPISLPDGDVPVAISAGSLHSFAIGKTGRLYAWGHNMRGQLGIGTYSTKIQLETDPPSPFELGEHRPPDDCSKDQLRPVLVTFADQRPFTAAAVVAGEDHSLAIGTDGQLYGWGSNGRHQLGIETTTSLPMPNPHVIRLPYGDPPASGASIAAGARHSLAIGQSGILYSWGDNDAGELGDGTAGTQEPAPTQVGRLGGAPVRASAIATGYYHSLAIIR